MEVQDKIRLIEEAIEVDEGSLTEDTVLVDMEEYDSMARLALIVMLDDEFGIAVDADVVKGFVTVADILKVIG